MSIHWSDYERVHADRRNLIIHLFAVPLFDVASLIALIAIAQGAWILAALTVLAAIAAMILQGFGHSNERFDARPFSGPVNFLQRWFSEQFIKFPVFVITGRWWRQYRTASSAAR